MATLLPVPAQQWIDTNGNPLIGGTIDLFIPGTTSRKTSWVDSGQVAANTNPVVLDAAGRAIIYGSGIYRAIVKDAAGVTIYDQLTASTDVGGLAWGGSSTGTANAQVIASSSFSQQDGQVIGFIAGFTNSSQLTVNGIPVLKDTGSGPTPLTGGEVTAQNAVTLIYQASRGAFHLQPIAPAILTVANGGTGSATAPGALTNLGVSAFVQTVLPAASALAAQTTLLIPATIPGYLSGGQLANNAGTPTTKIDVSAGSCSDSTAVRTMPIPAITKDVTASWALGTGNGSLDTGAIANNSYHVFAIMRPDTGVVDILTSLSATAPTMPANYTLFRRLGSIIRVAGIVSLFVQDGDYFYWNNASLANDYSGGNRAKSALTVNVPIGIRVAGIFSFSGFNSGAGGNVNIYDGTNTNISKQIARGATGGINVSTTNFFEQYTNTSAQVQLAITGGGSWGLATTGWRDARGR